MDLRNASASKNTELWQSLKIISYHLCTICGSGRLGESVLLQAQKCGGLRWRRSPGKAGEGKRPGEALPKGYKRVCGEDGSSLSGLICGKGNIAESSTPNTFCWTNSTQ